MNYIDKVLKELDKELQEILKAVLYRENEPPGDKKDDWLFLYKDNNGTSVWFNNSKLKNFIKQSLLTLQEQHQKEIEKVIDYISFKEGWEETGDKYRKHFGFKEKYNKHIK